VEIKDDDEERRNASSQLHGEKKKHTNTENKKPCGRVGNHPGIAKKTENGARSSA
jgi:hypothetical protein